MIFVLGIIISFPIILGKKNDKSISVKTRDVIVSYDIQDISNAIKQADNAVSLAKISLDSINSN